MEPSCPWFVLRAMHFIYLYPLLTKKYPVSHCHDFLSGGKLSPSQLHVHVPFVKERRWSSGAEFADKFHQLAHCHIPLTKHDKTYLHYKLFTVAKPSFLAKHYPVSHALVEPFSYEIDNIWDNSDYGCNDQQPSSSCWDYAWLFRIAASLSRLM